MERNISDIDNDKGQYQQIYVINHKTESVPKHIREVFFKCGNHCYDGLIPFNMLEYGEITLKDIPAIIPALQEQQNDLSFKCFATRYGLMNDESLHT